MKMDKAEIIAEAETLKQLKSSQQSTEVERMLADVLATIPAKNFGYQAMNKIAANVLEASEYAMLAYYLRPSRMFKAPLRDGERDKRVSLPESALKYHAGKAIPEKRQLALLALQKVLASKTFEEARNSQNEDKLTAYRVINNLHDSLTQIVAKTIEKAEKNPDLTNAYASPTTDKPTKGVPTQNPILDKPLSLVSSPAPAPEFNAVARVVAEEMKHIKPGTIKGTLLMFFSDVADISAPVLRILSQTTLRKESLSQQEAAKPLTDMGLQFADVVNMVNGAVLKIRAHAEGDEEYQFVLDALKNYRFE